MSNIHLRNQTQFVIILYMKLEIILIAIIAFLVYDTYKGGIYTKYLYSLKKYTRTISIIVLVFSIYLMLKKNPEQTPNLIKSANNFIRFLPLYKDGNSMNTFNGGNVETNNSLIELTKKSLGMFSPYDASTQKIINSGKHATKRSVSETKKKYVAAQQDWKCGGCGKKLNAWFEVDHKIRLEYGGGNNVENLVALCRECHGEKTAMENM